MRKDLEDSKFVLEGDFKRFDSTLYLIAITCGLAFIRCLYKLDSDYIDSHFCGIYDSLSIKDYHTVGEKVFRLIHGIPSGVKCTSLLGSVINLIVLAFSIKKNLRAFNFIVGGDDFLIVSRKGVYDKVKFIDKIKDRINKIGMRLKFLEIKYFGSKKISECPTFYKYCIYKEYATVPTKAVLERTFMPWNKNYDSDIKLLEFLEDIMPSLGDPLSHHYLYYKFFQQVYEAFTGSRIKLGTIFKKHRFVNNKMNINKDVRQLYAYKSNKIENEVVTVSYVYFTRRKAKNLIKVDISIF